MSDRAFYIFAALLLVVLTSIIGVVAYVILAAPHSGDPGTSAVQPQCQTFAQTNKTVCGVFLSYWNDHGGILRQGLPISSEFQEVSDTDRKAYTVQYFERAVLEHHTENQAPYDVLISLLGRLQFQKKYANGVQALDKLPAGMKPEGGAVFPQTGKDVRGVFLDYWLNNGGTLQYGYPISDAFIERSQLDGKDHIVQYFERSVFEYHPENQAPYDVQLSLLGRFQFERKYHNGDPGLARTTPSTLLTNTPAATHTAPATSAATAVLSATITPTPISTATHTSTPTFIVTPTPAFTITSTHTSKNTPIATGTAGPTPQLLFSDGLESASFKAWTSGDRGSASGSQAEVITSASYAGLWGAHFSNGVGDAVGSGSYWYANFSVPASHILSGQARIKINSAAGTGSFRVLHLRDQASQNSVLRVQYSNGTWQLALLRKDGTTSTADFATNIPIGSWQLLEITYDWSAAQPVGKAYLNGVLQATITDTTPGSNYSLNSIYCLVYEDAGPASGDVYFDNVKAAAGYIGP
ncbi:MAG: LamG-like jellyroll fold domain-containing protein [Chloroflexota bacterium]